MRFHLETTPAGARQLLAHGSDDLVEGRYIQTPREMLADLARFDAANGVMEGLLDQLTAVASGPPAQEAEVSPPAAPTRAGGSNPG